jgi:anion-transporting  ArsA/GET3 family ATPase
MMLDTKRTFDDLVAKHASSPEVRDRILGNKLYQHVSTSLAGTQEYMAMEKLYAIKGDPSYDLVILDTPPTTNALDFLDAPERMVGALDSPVLHWLVKAFQSSGKLGLNLLTRGAAAVLRGLSKLTGYGFLETLSEFIALINELFGGFKRRAAEVSRALRGPDVAYVLVTSPDPMSIREISYFADRLREQGMPRDALVVNRLHPRGGPLPDLRTIAEELERMNVRLDEGGAERVRRAAEDEARQGALDAQHLAALGDLVTHDGAPLRVDVPAFPGDVHDLATLARVARVICP